MSHHQVFTVSNERRQSGRWSIEGEAEVMVIAGERLGEMTTLRLTDAGDHGLGGWSRRPMPSGQPVTVGFAERGKPGRYGVIARCVPLENGWQLGIRLQSRLAA